MFDWTSGYVAELGYTYGFYRELTPTILQFSGLTKGVSTRKTGKDRLAFCELGGRVPGRGVTEVVKPLASAPLGAP